MGEHRHRVAVTLVLDVKHALREGHDSHELVGVVARRAEKGTTQLQVAGERARRVLNVEGVPF